MKYLFIVDYWMPFPSSEYGGIEGYVAKSRQDVINMIADDVDEYYRESYPNWLEMVKESVENARVYALNPEKPDGKEFSFTT
jgi:hypothetical protein